jgi:hypothetical protein
MKVMTSNIKFNISGSPAKKPGLAVKYTFFANDVGSIYA